MKLKRRISELERLLGTDKPNEQAQRVQQLMQPVLTLVIQADLRTGEVTASSLGANLPARVAYQMLDEARRLIAIEEGKAAKASPPAPSPAPGTAAGEGNKSETQSGNK